MTAYYNESDPYAAQWLRNLIAGQTGTLTRKYGGRYLEVRPGLVERVMDVARAA